MEQLALQKDLSIGDGNHIGGNVSRNIACLGFNNGQSGQAAAALCFGQTGCTLQQTAVEIEYIAGVSFASRRTANQQAQGTVGHCVLGKIVVHHQYILTLGHKVFAHGAARIGGNVLEGSQLAGAGTHHDGVVHGPVLGQGVHQMGYGALLLANGHIDADHPGTLLVQDGIGGDGGFAGLAVTNNQLTLTTTDGNHAIDGLNAGLQGHGNALALQNAGSRGFDGPPLLGLNRPVAINGLAHCVYHTANELLAHRHAHHLAGTLYQAAFPDAHIRAQHNDGYGVFFQVLCHAVLAVFKLHQLAVNGVAQAVDGGNAITNFQNGTGLIAGGTVIVMFNLLPQDGDNFFGLIHRIHLSCSWRDKR